MTFWEKIEPIFTPALKQEVDGAYKVFEKYKLSGTIIHCDCNVCMTEENAHALSTLPLKEISASLLGEYTNSAHGWNEIVLREFKHFLPRYFELIAQCDPPCHLGLETTLARLDGYKDWPKEEVQAVDAFFDAFLDANIGQLGLIQWPVGLRLEFDLADILIMIVYAGGDLVRALDVFDKAEDPAAALHMSSLRANVLPREGGYQLDNAFLSDRKEFAYLIGDWLMRDEVTKRIESQADKFDGTDYEEVIFLGL